MATTQPIQTIEQQFQHFCEYAFPRGLSGENEQAARDLFFAGFIAATATFTEDIPHLPVGRDIQAVVNLRREGQTYAETKNNPDRSN